MSEAVNGLEHRETRLGVILGQNSTVQSVSDSEKLAPRAQSLSEGPEPKIGKRICTTQGSNLEPPTP